jgi:hypothetical protein
VTAKALDINREMAVFDTLPRKIRSALNDSKTRYVFIADWVPGYVQQVGVERAAKAIRTGTVPNVVKVKVECN